MGFGEAIRTCFGKYVTFQGRAIRSEYWYFVLFAILASIPAAILDAIVAPSQRNGPFSALLSLALFLPSLSVSVRRLHDINRSGWWIGGLYIYTACAILLAIVVLAGGGVTNASGLHAFLLVLLLAGFVGYAILLLVFALLKGTDGPNQYGADPLQSATKSG